VLAQAVKHLPSKHEALNSSPSAVKKKDLNFGDADLKIQTKHPRGEVTLAGEYTILEFREVQIRD
jgi:hypothetical protein